ncbi:MAG: hypothetical protein ACP5L2_08155, partial [Conexivisphaera sp.]
MDRNAMDNGGLKLEEENGKDAEPQRFHHPELPHEVLVNGPRDLPPLHCWTEEFVRSLARFILPTPGP